MKFITLLCALVLLSFESYAAVSLGTDLHLEHRDDYAVTAKISLVQVRDEAVAVYLNDLANTSTFHPGSLIFSGSHYQVGISLLSRIGKSISLSADSIQNIQGRPTAKNPVLNFGE